MLPEICYHAPMQLLRTKLFAPTPRPEELLRPALYARLHDGLSAERTLTVIVAPAGFGKTTLLAGALSGRPVAWLTLDAADNDPLRFARYLVAALAGPHPTMMRSIIALLETQPALELPDVCAAIINAFADADPTRPPTILALDDYHTITASAVHQALALLIEHLPPQLRLILLTRADPLLPLARLRANGRLLELRADDLRFSQDETRLFLHRVVAESLAEADIAALHRRTEGWPAGVRLAAISLQGAADPSRVIAEFTGDSRVVVDYLIEEVFARQPVSLQQFWMDTAVLERMCADLCDTLLQFDGYRGPQARDVLEHLHHAHLFVTQLDTQRQWYRYHPLFADLLRSRLVREAPERVPVLHRVAGDWYAQHGLPAEAIHHACAAGDVAVAAERIIVCIPELMQHNEVRSLAALVEALPETFPRTHPELGIGYTRALVSSGRLAEAARLLDDLAHAPLTPEQEIDRLVTRSVIAGAYGDRMLVQELTQHILHALPNPPPSVHGMLTFSAALAATLHGDVATALRHCRLAVTALQASGNLPVLLTALNTLGILHTAAGDLAAASEAYRQAIRHATLPGGVLLSVSGAVFAGMARLSYEGNDLEHAEQEVRRSVELCQRWGNPGLIAESWATLARIVYARGASAAAAQALDRAVELVAALPETLPGVAQVQTVHSLLNAVSTTAAQPTIRLVGIPVDALPPMIAEERRLALAASDLRDPETIVLLRQVRDAAQMSGRHGRVVAALALEAVALLLQGDPMQARDVAYEALNQSAGRGYVRTFIDLGQPMVELLAQIARSPEQSAARTEAVRLLRHLPPVPPSNPGALSMDLTDEPIEPLSSREIEVLHLVAAGLSNHEIAERLVLAPGTVKRHLHNIFGKLGVEDRLQAVNRGRAFGIL